MGVDACLSLATGGDEPHEASVVKDVRGWVSCGMLRLVTVLLCGAASRCGERMGAWIPAQWDGIGVGVSSSPLSRVGHRSDLGS